MPQLGKFVVHVFVGLGLYFGIPSMLYLAVSGGIWPIGCYVGKPRLEAVSDKAKNSSPEHLVPLGFLM